MAKGIALSSVLSDDASAVALTATDLQLLQQAGAQVARVEFRLGTAHETWDSTVLGLYTQVVTQLQGVGIGVIGLLDPAIVAGSTQDAWNLNNTENTPGAQPTNPFVDSFVHAAAQIALAGGPVESWEIWNEPNAWTSQSGTVYSGGSYIYPSIYATLLTRMDQLLKALDPAYQVISGGLFGHNIGGILSPTNSGATYFDAVCAQLQARGAGTTAPWPFDAAGQHLYLDQGGAASNSHVSQYLDNLEVVLEKYSGAPHAITVTEAAWSTRTVTQDVQASNLQILYQACASHTFVDDTLWFLLHDIQTANLYYGLCTNATATPPEAPKLSYATYQGLAP